MAISSASTFDTSGIQIKKDACIVIVRTEWNAETVDQLEQGCRNILKQHHAAIKVINVPGAVEISFAIKNYWEKNKYKDCKPDAFITLGCVIQGGTPHFDYVCKFVTEGVMHLNLQLPVPVIFGVLTVNSQEQANERIGGIHGHKGEEAAATAIKMISLYQSF